MKRAVIFLLGKDVGGLVVAGEVVLELLELVFGARGSADIDAAGVGGETGQGALIGVHAAELQFGGVAAGGGIEFGSGGEATAAATAGDAVDVVGADGTADANQGHRHGGLDLAAGLLVDRVAVDGADGEAGAIPFGDNRADGITGIGVGAHAFGEPEDELAAGNLTLALGQSLQRGEGGISVFILDEALRILEPGPEQPGVSALR